MKEQMRGEVNRRGIRGLLILVCPPPPPSSNAKPYLPYTYPTEPSPAHWRTKSVPAQDEATLPYPSGRVKLWANRRSPDSRSTEGRLPISQWGALFPAANRCSQSQPPQMDCVPSDIA
jgi:hypothetical protein